MIRLVVICLVRVESNEVSVVMEATLKDIILRSGLLKRHIFN